MQYLLKIPILEFTHFKRGFNEPKKFKCQFFFDIWTFVADE